MTNNFKQCLLTRADDSGNLSQVSWIEEKFAVLNKTLRLKENGSWIDGWVVSKVYDSILTENEIISYKDDYRKMRAVTDI